MRLDYVPLLQIQRDIQGMPKGMDRFRHYLRTIWNCYETDFELIPLMYANPMGKDHVTATLDELLALGAEQVAADAAALASERLADVPGEFKAAVIVADDLMGGWTNRYDYEFNLRFGPSHSADRDERAAALELQRPKWSKFIWVTGVLWSSEPASLHSRARGDAHSRLPIRVCASKWYAPHASRRTRAGRAGHGDGGLCRTDAR